MIRDLISIFLLIMLFGVVSSIVFFAISQYLNYSMVRNRLNLIRTENVGETEQKITISGVKAQKIFHWFIGFSMTKEKWESSVLRERLMRAGYHNELNALIFLAAKSMLAAILPIIYFIYILIFGSYVGVLLTFLFCILLSGLGYYAPDLWLLYRTKLRQRQIFDSFPNALDLMRVCISAGLGLDSAIDRVGKELKIESMALAEEFHMLNLELRTGATHENALRNLASRTGVDDIHALVGMLIQTEHFGTSVAEALRVHADGLRSKRTLRAQEAAAKIPVKLTIPMILCIFPALMVVVLGPALLSISNTMFPAMSGYMK